MDDAPQRTPQPFPDAPYLAPWIAASWRAFGTVDTPPHVAQHRSFDGGNQPLPGESNAIYTARQDDHRRFDAAERELMELLGGGQVRAKGQPPARDECNKRLHVASLAHVDIPPSTFLNPQLAFTAGGELIQRLPILARIFPMHELRRSKTSPDFPLYHDVLIEAAELRKIWEPARIANDGQDILKWLTAAAETYVCERKVKPKRDVLVRDCVAELQCRYEDAEAAYSLLPKHLRRTRGERDKRSKSAS